ncbi:FAD-dependent monooxygenase [Streptomyces sp. 1331.2]|uniref:FAD-dependent monooxygenase n=1 Tax=Streptomyces sp. 1331.2 TaxID=1938835 RepID=UPI000BD2ABF2|nr:FAD-dependent monooxygenase [Streptomyces sp. 1331.2]SOB85284.1 2-polyprenyl-6-methoxyphenol hydroxylase [Streptomyces sp. 1331.2]
MRVGVVGGGIAGLSCALSLHAAGFRPWVCEAARAIEAVGVGINLLPHAVRELAELGLADELAAIALAPQRLRYYDRAGAPVWDEPLGTAAGYRWPQYSVHRGRLHTLLLAAVVERLGPDAVRTGRRLQHFETVPGGVRAHFLDRPTGATVVEEAEVLVGADGINSAVRARLHPHESAARRHGVLMWRGIAPRPRLLDGRSLVVAGGTPGAKFVAYPIAPTAEPGEDLLNWVLEVPDEPPAAAPGHSGCPTTPTEARPVTATEAQARLREWQLPWIDLPALVGHTSPVLAYPMADRDPLPSWSAGRVTLLGDAAHPMLPMGMNGGSQSVIDARVLAWCLAREADPVAALRQYDDLRRPVLNALVLANRALGPEEIIARAAEHGGPLPADRAAAVSGRYKELSLATVADVNDRPSWTVPRPDVR